MTLKLHDADLRGIDITVVPQGDRYQVWMPYALMLVTPEELARFAMTILKELGVTPLEKTDGCCGRCSE